MNAFRRLGTALIGLATATQGMAAAPACRATPKLEVDADGAPDSYRVDGKGLSYTCDGVFAVVNGVAQTQNNNPAHWQELCRTYWTRAKATGDYSKVKIVGFARGADGRPIVQGSGDPLPNIAYVTTTTLSIPDTPEGTQRHYVDANEIPYVVISPAFGSTYRIAPGDVVAVYRPAADKYAFGVYGDCCSLGEASVRLHYDLGNDPIVVTADGTHRAKRGIADRVIFAALPGAHTHPTLDAARWREEIREAGRTALARWGGVERLRACAAGR